MKSKLFIGLLLVACNAFAGTENQSEAKHIMVIATQEDKALIAAAKNIQFPLDSSRSTLVNLFGLRDTLSHITQRSGIETMKIIEIDQITIADESSRKNMIEYLIDHTPAFIFITGTDRDNKIVDTFITQFNQTSQEHLAIPI